MMKELFRKYLENQCTGEELELLLTHFDKPENEQLLKDLIHDILTDKQVTEHTMWEENAAIIFESIRSKIHPAKARVIPIFKMTWFRVAAACLILILGTTAYFLVNNNSGKPSIAKNNLSKDVEAPKSTRAMITLADGKKVYLDNTANGELATQSNIKLVKLANGDIIYQTATGETVTQLQYNTLSNPRGSKAISLTLNDGTKVWLNSESSLKYPVAFVDNERKVEITGEAYFEVTKDATKPFKVNIAGKGEVEVLGTHFNINAYNDEATANTTLLEGSVKITSLTTSNSQLLRPGEQAQLNAGGQININRNADIEEIMAWKNGQFVFNSMDVKTIMRQIGRWYDIEVVYEGAVSKETFSGIVNRISNVSQVLKIMDESGVKFRIEGKKLTVLQ